MSNNATEQEGESNIFYDGQDWIADYTWYCGFVDAVRHDLLSTEIPADMMAPHFLEKYKTSESAKFHMERFCAAMTYLELHWKELDVRPAAVLGEKRAIVSRCLIITMHQIFAFCSADMLKRFRHEYPVSDVIDLCKENEKLNL